MVSNDTHIGPRLVDDLRPYCPSAHLEDFDRFAAETAAQFQATVSTFNGGGFLHHPNLRTLGHYDSAARLADYNYDGIAAGVIFHGSMNMEPIPFISGGVGVQNRGDAELMGVGQHIYNQWLADFVSQAPHRHVGLAYVPIWNLDAAVAEVEWAHEAGLRGVNFPAMRDGESLVYNDPSWEPLWAVCEERQMPLVTHIGGGSTANYSGPEKVPLIQFESAYMSRRAVWWLILAGVFERRPGLKLVITETPGNWFPGTAIELDAIHRYYTDRETPLNAEFVERVPRLPSEYMKANVFVGASFRVSLRGGTGHPVWARHPGAVGFRLPTSRRNVPESGRPRDAVGDAARVCVTPSARFRFPRPCGWWARTPSRCTTSTPLRSEPLRARSAHRRQTIWRRRSMRYPRAPAAPHSDLGRAGGAEVTLFCLCRRIRVA